MRNIIKLAILSLFIMVLIYGDSYSQDNHRYVKIHELKKELMAELEADGFINNGEYSITYNFSEDELKINGRSVSDEMTSKYTDIILDYYQRDTHGIFIMAKPYIEGEIKGEIIGIKLD